MLLALPSLALGQGRPRIQPGTVATASVMVDAPAAESGEALSYLIDPLPGVTLYIPATGTFTPGPTGGRIPLTFMVPSSFPAGPARIAEVRLETRSGTLTLPLLVEVLPLRALEFAPDPVAVQVSPGRRVENRHHLANRGNAPATIELAVVGLSTWQPQGLPASLPLEAATAHRLVLLLRAPENSVPGRRERLLVVARGRGTRVVAERSIDIVPAGGLAGALVSVPGSVTAVVPLRGGGAGVLRGALPGVAFHAAGEIAPGVGASLDLRYLPAALRMTSAPLLLGGTASSLELHGAGWSVGAGTNVSRLTPLAGRYLYGPGVRGSYTAGRYRLDASAGSGAVFGGNGERRAFHLTAARNESWGRIELLGGIMEGRRWYDDEPAPVLASAGVGFELSPSSGHQARGEVGWLRTAAGAVRGSGPVADLSYRFHGERLEASTRVRRVPGLPGETAAQVQGEEVSGWSRYWINQRFAVYANAGAFNSPLAGTAPLRGGTRNAAAGAHWRAGRLRAEFGGQYNARPALLGGAAEGVLAVARIAAPLGAGNLDLQGGRGWMLGSGRPLDRLRVGYTLHHAVGWNWVAFSTEQGLWGRWPPLLELGSTSTVRDFDLQAGGGFQVRDRFRPATAWMTGEYRTAGSSSVRLTARYHPWSRERVEIYAGFRARLGVPLPVRRKATRSGLIFDDRNGSGTRDPGEPGLASVRVIVGTGTGTGTIFERDLAGMTVLMIDANGRIRAAATSARGVADFGAVVPGDYRIEIVPLGRTEPTAASKLSVPPGESVEHRINIPEFRRPIEMQPLPMIQDGRGANHALTNQSPYS